MHLRYSNGNYARREKKREYCDRIRPVPFVCLSFQEHPNVSAVRPDALSCTSAYNQ